MRHMRVECLSKEHNVIIKLPNAHDIPHIFFHLVVWIGAEVHTTIGMNNILLNNN